MLKIVLLVALVPLVLGSPMNPDPMVMMKVWEKMQEMQGGDQGGQWGDQGGEWGDQGGQHHSKDGDCKSEDEAMRKNYEMFKKAMKMRKEMEAKHMMEEASKKMKKFEEWSQMMKEKEEKEEMEKKQRMWMMMQKHEEEKRKMEKEGEFNELIESFTMQKTKFAFGLTHHFLTMCKCGEIDYQMKQMFEGEQMGNSSGMAEGMGNDDIMEEWSMGNYEQVARMLKMMPKEEQKKMYMSNLIKSMCKGATEFINKAKTFQEQYMSESQSPPAGATQDA